MEIKIVPYTNNTDTDVIIGNVTIKPGTTRQVDARFAPAKPEVNAALKVWYFNFGETQQYFGNITVEPNTSARLSANHFVDPNTAANKVQTNIFTQLLANNINVINNIIEHSDLTSDELLVIIELEKAADTPRKTLISELQAMANTDPDDSYVLELSQMSDQDLELEKIKVAGDDEKLTAVDVELAKRQG